MAAAPRLATRQLGLLLRNRVGSTLPVTPRLAQISAIRRWNSTRMELDSKQRTEAEYPALDAGELSPLKTCNVMKADATATVSGHHKVSFDDRKVLVPWDEGKTSHFHHIWLRDHCQCKHCRHEETKQRLLDTFSIPRNIKPDDVVQGEEGLTIKWKDGHESSFSFKWLHLHSYKPRLEKYLSPQFKFWGAEIADELPEVDYEAIMESDKGVAIWVHKIYKYGFCLVNNVPPTPEATQSLIERIAFIRHTHYGGFWDFTADLAKKDLAYSDVFLGVHTDNTYFSDPAGLQMFHLLSHTDGSGGANTFVDGFRAAKLLREENPEAYKTLSSVRIPAHASGNEDSSIQPFAPFPVFNHHPVNGELMQIRWNNDDRGTMDRWGDMEDVEKFYDACRAWNDVLTRKENVYRVQLKPGHPLIFDNWRVLHGREAFTGKRRMCGAYVNRDDWISRFKTLTTKRETVLNAL